MPMYVWQWEGGEVDPGDWLTVDKLHGCLCDYYFHLTLQWEDNHHTNILSCLKTDNVVLNTESILWLEISGDKYDHSHLTDNITWL